MKTFIPVNVWYINKFFLEKNIKAFTDMTERCNLNSISKNSEEEENEEYDRRAIRATPKQNTNNFIRKVRRAWKERR